jgi:hypothetical protein
VPRKGSKAKATKGKGRKATTPEVDLTRVRDIARAGVWQAGPIADILNLPRSALLNSSIKDVVQEAIQQGKSQHFYAALQAYDKAVESKNGNLTGLCIFKLKQHGWQDRPNLDLGEMSPLELQGATDRYFAMLERYMRKVDAEGAA